MPITKTEIDILLRAKAELTAFKQAKGEVSGIQKELTKSNAAFKQFGSLARNAVGALGIGISVQGVTAAIGKVIDYGEQITDLSKQANISTDAFQALALEARRANVSNEQFAGTLAFLRKSLSEASAGIGESRIAFKGLGLDARALAKLPTERALEEIARAAANADDKATAYAYTLKILGEGSRNLTPVLDRLAKDGFDKVAESAKGFVIPPEQLKTLDEAGDNLERIGTGGLVFGARLLNTVVNSGRVLKEGETVMERIKAFSEDFQARVALINPGVMLGRAAVDALGVSTDTATESAGELADETRRVAEAAQQAATAVQAIELSMEEAAVAAKAFADGQAFIARHLAEQDQARVAAAKEALSINERAARLGERQDRAALDALHPLDRAIELKNRINALEAQQKEAIGDSNEAIKTRLDYEEKLFDLRREFAGIGGGSVEGSLDLFFGNLDAASSSMGDLKEETKETADFAKELGNTFASAFEEAIVGGGKFKDVLRGLAQDILRLFVRQQISTPIANYFSGLFSGLFGGGKATGGDVEVGKFYKVGEQGTELFAPGMSGTIIPNHAIAASAGNGGGGDVFHFDYTFTGGVTQGDIARMIPQIVTASKNAVLDAKRRSQPGFA